MARSLSSVKRTVDGRYRFAAHFDPKTGYYLRTGILDQHGDDTGVDPFMAEFPHLLDIGIMGHCHHGLSGHCAQTGVQCYQNGAAVHQPNMALADFKWITDEARGRVFQFALGGRGDPELHDDFEAMLDYSRKAGIVPNLTTSGFRLTRPLAGIIKRFCGAAAVSWYKTEYTFRAIELLLAAGVKTNLHFVLGRDTIDEALAILEHRRLPGKINRLIFLLFKPVGQGTGGNVLDARDERVQRLFGLIDTPAGAAMSGFDSCCVPALVNHAALIDPASYDTCEAGRFSAYVTPDMKLLPCSFDQQLRWAVDLQGRTLQEAWVSPQFEEFRSRLRAACPGCSRRELCLGGCPIKPEIVLCSRRATSGEIGETRGAEREIS